ASYTCAPRWRSAARANSAAVRIGNAISTSTLVARMFQVKIGIRNMVMPGARMQTTVVVKLTAARMVPRPDTINPMIHRSPPGPDEWMASDNGVYPVQPKSAAPPGTMKPDKTIKPPNRNNQYEKAFSRG